MMMELTTFDIAALLLIFISTVISALRGLMGELISFAGWVVALLAARLLAVSVADVVFATMQPRVVAVICAFVLVYVCARVSVAVVHQVLDLVVKKTNLSHLNRLLGGLLGALKGIIVVSLVVLACSFSDLPQHPEWKNALTIPFFEQLALLEKSYLPESVAQQIVFPAHESEVQAASEAAPVKPKVQILTP